MPSSPAPEPDPIGVAAGPRRRTIPFRLVLGAMLGLVAVAALGVWALYLTVIGTPAHPTTVAELEAKLRRATPIGCDRDRVLLWIRTDPLKPEAPTSVEHGPGRIQSIVRDTYRSLACRGQIAISWRFDPAGKLAEVEVIPVDECL